MPTVDIDVNASGGAIVDAAHLQAETGLYRPLYLSGSRYGGLRTTELLEHAAYNLARA